MFQRHIEGTLRTALADTPVALLNGARQTGKSTLALQLAKRLGGHYVTLDDATTLAGAASDPVGFIGRRPGLTVIDEVQKVPQLFSAIKVQVDTLRRPGRFLLTGSANVMLLPRLSESLAGRMEIVTLCPLSQGELHGRRERFIESVFSPALPRLAKPAKEDFDLLEKVVRGGYPEAVARGVPRRREAWFSSYITALLHRDVRDLANIDGLTEMPRLMQFLAARVGGVLNFSDLSRVSTIPQSTLKRYLTLLEATFLFQPLRAWSTNVSKRLIKSPKIHLLDSGLTAHLTGHTFSRVKEDRFLMGSLLETFVLVELRKHMTWTDHDVSLFHYRTTTGREVDMVLEDRAGGLVGVEVKASGTVGRRDFAGLESLAEDAKKRFLRGIVLYAGEEVVPFGDRLHAMPISSLWRMSEA